MQYTLAVAGKLIKCFLNAVSNLTASSFDSNLPRYDTLWRVIWLFDLWDPTNKAPSFPLQMAQHGNKSLSERFSLITLNLDKAAL